MAKSTIPNEIQKEAIRMIDDYNLKKFPGKIKSLSYFPEFKENFLYLKRKEYGQISPVARLTYSGNIKKWKFAIFKWSTEKYDPDEWLFPGAKYVDGTIKGAMEAGMMAYPI